MSNDNKSTDAKVEGSFMGFRIKREVDVLALLAFIGSLAALSWQGWNALRGPDVYFAPIGQAVLYLKEVEDSSGMKGNVLYLAAATTLYNIGAPGYGDFVGAQSATLSLGTCKVVFDAQNVVKLGKSGGRPELPTYIDDWGGVALEHGKSATRSIEFSALFKIREQDLECIKAERLFEELASVSDAKVLFEAQTTSGKVTHYTCEIKGFSGLSEELRLQRVSALGCS